MPTLGPSKKLESTLRIISSAMRCSNTAAGAQSVRYWLCFGGLWGIVQNNGIIPDGDLDLCCYYGEDWRPIAHAFKRHGYDNTKVLVNDTDKDKALYAAFESKDEDLPHICLSFWYEHAGVRYYCHDQHHEVHGVGVPEHGYSFKGVPAGLVEDTPENFFFCEWPGIPGSIKVRVPRSPGGILDHLYPAWPYRRQRYMAKYEVVPDKMVCYHRGGAISPYMIHVKSMAEWANSRLVSDRLAEGRVRWLQTAKGF